MKVKKPSRKVFQYKSADFIQIREDLRAYHEDHQTQDSSVNQTWSAFEAKLKELMEKHIPSMMLSGTTMDRQNSQKPKKEGKETLTAKQKQTGKPKGRRHYLCVKAQAQRLERQSCWKYVENPIDFSRDMTKPTNWVCAQRRLRSAWASAQSDQPSLSAWRNLRSLATQWAHSEGSDQTGRMPRLIWVFPGRTVTWLVLSCRGSFGRCWSKLFRFAKSLKKDSSGVASLRDQGRLQNDPFDKANTLNRQYQSEFTDEDKENPSRTEGDPSRTLCQTPKSLSREYWNCCGNWIRTRHPDRIWYMEDSQRTIRRDSPFPLQYLS